MSIINKYTVSSIDSHLTYDWLLNKHYAKRIPSISYAFGLYNSNILCGIMTIGKPASPSLCDGVCGKENSKYVYELNRLCVDDNLEKNVLSFFVSKCIKLINDEMIIVSYADTSMNHNGYIYQATNWIYTGLSDKRTEWQLIGSNSHSKSLCDKYTTEEMRNSDKFEMAERPRKHRYVYFIGKLKKHFKKSLNYKIEDYPKGQNQKYDSSYKPEVQLNLF
jgi:hypothetical protein